VSSDKGEINHHIQIIQERRA